MASSNVLSAFTETLKEKKKEQMNIKRDVFEDFAESSLPS